MKKRTIFITCGIVLASIAAILTGGSLYMLNFSLCQRIIIEPA